ncbi:1-hydroxy-2-methyl-2-butenyl 4-diphosphate reductase [Streptomyces sp. NPDC051211]|uniref:phosphorylase family protein n=1 Tax=Streptomyces sp. NPDC051211 TaxID=3154643 RepID=UPI00344FA2AC
MAAPPLLVACALGIERLALGRPERAGARGPVTVIRTGMGPRAAERAVDRELARPGMAGAAVVATGFCAGLAPGMHPGDLVVAEATRDPRGTVLCDGTGLLAEALARALPGRTVHIGLLTGSDHVVRGHERAELRAGGAVAVDMESAATLWAATRGRGPAPGAGRGALRGAVPEDPVTGSPVDRAVDRAVGPAGVLIRSAGGPRVAAVRVIVDAPEHELVRIGTVRGGISAFRVLRAVLPAFFDWHHASLLPRR